MTEAEEWRQVVGWEGLYEVSSIGRVKRIAPNHGTRPGRLMIPQPFGRGYLRVILRDAPSRNPTCYLVNRLVCSAFHGEPPTDAHQAAHNDGVYTNNRASNLRWATQVENEKDKILHDRTTRGEKNGQAKLTADDVIEIRRQTAAGVMQKDVADTFGLSKNYVGELHRREKWSHL